MKSKKAVYIKGVIMDSSLLGEITQPFCIHWVRFDHGKYAVVRAVSGLCLKPGSVIERLEDEWFYDHDKIRLLGFEYLEKAESIRQFIEYY